jgi:hypothetical protein
VFIVGAQGLLTITKVNGTVQAVVARASLYVMSVLMRPDFGASALIGKYVVGVFMDSTRPQLAGIVTKVMISRTGTFIFLKDNNGAELNSLHSLTIRDVP